MLHKMHRQMINALISTTQTLPLVDMVAVEADLTFVLVGGRGFCGGCGCNFD